MSDEKWTHKPEVYVFRCYADPNCQWQPNPQACSTLSCQPKNFFMGFGAQGKKTSEMYCPWHARDKAFKDKTHFKTCLRLQCEPCGYYTLRRYIAGEETGRTPMGFVKAVLDEIEVKKEFDIPRQPRPKAMAAPKQAEAQMTAPPGISAADQTVDALKAKGKGVCKAGKGQQGKGTETWKGSGKEKHGERSSSQRTRRGHGTWAMKWARRAKGACQCQVEKL